MSKYFVIADLHGRYDLYQKAKKHFMDNGHDGDEFVILGDMIDRGPQSAQIIDNLISLQEELPVTVLQGNHEAMMLATIREPYPSNINWWVGNGGNMTIASYGAIEGMLYADAINLVPNWHLKWVRELPLTYVTDKYIFVHAGVDPSIPLESQTAQTLQWKLYKDNMTKGHEDRHVVHGHHQHENGPKLYGGRTNLDTFAWYTGRLVMGIFDSGGDNQEFVEFIGPSYDEQRLLGDAE